MGIIKSFMNGWNADQHKKSDEEWEEMVKFAQEYWKEHPQQPKPVDPNIPRCPVCRSPEIQKIGAGKRAVHGAAFGLFSKTARSQWECKHCGNKW